MFQENTVYFQDPHADTITADVKVTKIEEYFNFENAAVIYDFSTVFSILRLIGA